MSTFRREHVIYFISHYPTTTALSFSARREVMSHPVTVLRTREKVGRIVGLLKAEPHNGFPVVQDFDPDNQSMGSGIEVRVHLDYWCKVCREMVLGRCVKGTFSRFGKLIELKTNVSDLQIFVVVLFAI
ncbi:hypothetical protein DPMN_027582 [Dreissena polymorpha]|uniref:Uncharacterized protein n=1 Tax=Dreissena polymorpha TaxID=45954 RepID=A0A9D4LTS1_DREPO|nr:hypothetical protein DPMN_027582 [Dreissena polymorpha]